jgi:dTDP-4-dehydrorhamnose reductase
VYGRSKLAGERAVLGAPHVSAVVVRTAWLYAAKGRNFVNTMLRLMSTRESIGVVMDQVGSPTWAKSLAAAIWGVVRNPAIRGVQHWCDAGVASWYDFAVAIQEEALSRRLLDRRIPLHAIRTADYPTPARRPKYSVLDTRQTTMELGLSPLHWRENLRRALDELVAE